MQVYIIFGDVARSDGDNIIGIYASRSDAERAKELAEKFGAENLHIEEHEVQFLKKGV